jgi:predicted alpha/beta hydrolase
VTTSPPPYHQLWIDRGDHRLGLQAYPDPGDEAAAVVLWPAMGVPARFYRPFAGALRDAGLAVTVADLRGTGASEPYPSRRSRYGYADLAGDVGAVLAHLRHRLDGRRVVLVGHSLGGQACLLHLARAAGRDAGGAASAGVAGVALVAVGIPYWRIYGRRWPGVLAFTQGIHAVSTLCRVWPGWGFGGRQARGVIRDWAYTSRTGRFPAIDGVDIEAALARVRTPVLAVSLDRDQYTPPASMDHLVGKLAAAPVRREHLDGGYDHFTWARSANAVAERVAAFATGDLPH